MVACVTLSGTHCAPVTPEVTRPAFQTPSSAESNIVSGSARIQPVSWGSNSLRWSSSSQAAMEVYGVILTLLRSIVAVWDFLTWPIYQAVYWKISKWRIPGIKSIIENINQAP